VAVLPFENAGGDPNAEYLSDGIAESLINSLSQLPSLKVMSRDSAFHHRGKETDAQTVGQVLGVQAVFKGRVVEQGDTLTIRTYLHIIKRCPFGVRFECLAQTSPERSTLL
jgi:TolB-like protein